MSVDPRGEKAARGAALRGAGVGLLLAAALLGPALVAGGVPARGDLPDFFWPMKAYTAQRWVAGGAALWNPLSGAGEPWLAQLQSGVLYPGDLPFLLGWRDGAVAGIALHLALAAAGAAFWLWELGGSRPAALMAGGLYAGGGAFLSLVPVYNNACTAAWLPWLFVGARRVVVGRSRGAGFAIAVAGAFLAGEPALAAAGSVAAVFLALFAGLEGEPPRRAYSGRVLGRTVFPLLAGVALAGAALVPFAGLLRTSGRRAGTTRGEAVAQPIAGSDLADVVSAPRPEVTRTTKEGRSGYLATLALGPLPLLLAAGGGAGLPGRRRLLVGLALLGAGGFMVSLGASGMLTPLFYDVGILRGVRFPARWVVLPHLVLAIAAGAGLDGWLWGIFRTPSLPAPGDVGSDEAREAAARSRTAIAWLGGALLVVIVLTGLACLVAGIRAERDPLRTFGGAAAALAGIAVVGFARWRSPNPAPSAGTVLAALALAPLPWIAGAPLASLPARAVSSVSPALEGLARGPEAGRVFAPAGQDRTLALRWKYAGGAGWGEGAVSRAAAALAGYSNLFHGVATAGSGSPLGNPRVDRLVGAALAGGDAAGIFALLNVKHVVTPFPARIPGLNLELEKDGIRRYGVPGAFGRSFLPLESRVASDDEVFEALSRPGFDPGKVALVAPSPEANHLPPPRPKGAWAAARFLSDEPEKAEIATTASTPSLLVLTRCWDPGWVARVDGAPIAVLRAQLAYLAVVVPAGEHRLEIAYRPASFRVGLALSAAGLLAVLALALAGPPAGSRT